MIRARGPPPHCTSALSFLSLLHAFRPIDLGPPGSERSQAGSGKGGVRVIRCALDLLASWFLRILAGARTLKRRLTAARAHSFVSGHGGRFSTGAEKRTNRKKHADARYLQACSIQTPGQGMAAPTVPSRVCPSMPYGPTCVRYDLTDHKGQGESHSLNDRQERRDTVS